MLPKYGSKLPEYIDKGITRALELDIAAEIIRALALWEPRVNIVQVKTQSVAERGQVSVDIICKVLGKEFSVALVM